MQLLLVLGFYNLIAVNAGVIKKATCSVALVKAR